MPTRKRLICVGFEPKLIRWNLSTYLAELVEWWTCERGDLLAENVCCWWRCSSSEPELLSPSSEMGMCLSGFRPGKLLFLTILHTRLSLNETDSVPETSMVYQLPKKKHSVEKLIIGYVKDLQILYTGEQWRNLKHLVTDLSISGNRMLVRIIKMPSFIK